MIWKLQKEAHRRQDKAKKPDYREELILASKEQKPFPDPATPDYKSKKENPKLFAMCLEVKKDLFAELDEAVFKFSGGPDGLSILFKMNHDLKIFAADNGFDVKSKLTKRLFRDRDAAAKNILVILKEEIRQMPVMCFWADNCPEGFIFQSRNGGLCNVVLPSAIA